MRRPLTLPHQAIPKTFILNLFFTEIKLEAAVLIGLISFHSFKVIPFERILSPEDAATALSKMGSRDQAVKSERLHPRWDANSTTPHSWDKPQPHVNMEYLLHATKQNS